MSGKIAILARNVPPLYGGGGMLARTLASLFYDSGYQVDLLTDTPAPLGVEGVRVMSPYSEEPSMNILARSVRRLTEYRWLKKKIMSGGYTVVYGVSAQPFTLSGVAAAQSLGIPAAFETSLLGSDDYITLGKKRLGPVLQKFFRNADRIVNISPPLEEVCRSAGIDPSKLRMIPNPVDENIFVPASADERLALREQLGVNSGATLILTAGAVTHRKGYDRVIAAFAELAPKFPDLILACAGPLEKHDAPDFIAGLNSVLDEAGVSDRVLWLGRIDNVADWMRAADVFVFGSRREGFGTVFTEAMATQTPIQAYAIPGITDYLFGPEFEACIELHHAKFCRALSEKIQNSNKRLEVGKALRGRFESEFSSARILEQYQGLFEEITS